MIPRICPCGAPIHEDLQLAADARVLTPGLAIRQWRCLNGHPITHNPYLETRHPTFEGVCDICGLPVRSFREHTKRHAACDAEHDRRRLRKYADSLTVAGKAGCNGRG